MPHISTKDNQGTPTMTTWANKMGWTKGKKWYPKKRQNIGIAQKPNPYRPTMQGTQANTSIMTAINKK